CYGRSNKTALNSKAVELKSAAGKGGKCAVSNHTNRVQQCGPAGFGGVGLCGAAECSTMCTQDPNCTAYYVDIDVDKGRCFLVFNETPSDVDEDTSDTYRCFGIKRDVEARSSDWFNIFLHVGFRDVATEPNGTAIDLTNLPSLIPAGPETETCGTGGCSMNCNTTDCCETLRDHPTFDEKRCCTGTRYSEKGRTCCTFDDHYYYETLHRCCTRIGDEPMTCVYVTDEGNITSSSDYGQHYSSDDDFTEEETPGPEIETCGTDGCSMNCNTTDCCKTLRDHATFDEKRCCTGTRYSEKGRTCCTFDDHYYYETLHRCCTRIGDEPMTCVYATDEGNITSSSDYGQHYSSDDDFTEEET
ncbi:Hypothetical Protein FCC1311_114932, partial [Hondaea fermentalgiana]